MNTKVKEFAKEKGLTGIIYLSKWKGCDAYSVYNPTDEWKRGDPLYHVLVKDDGQLEIRSGFDSEITYDLIWNESEDDTEEKLTRRAPFKKMYTLNGMYRISKKYKLTPRTMEEMMQRIYLYRNIFADDIGAWELGGDPDYVCFVVDYCIKKGIPLDETPPEGVLF